MKIKKKIKPDMNFKISAAITVCYVLVLALVYFVRNSGYSQDVIAQKANQYYINEQYFLAARYYGKAIELSCDGADILKNYGVTLSKLGHYDASIKYLRYSSERDEYNPETYYCLGNAYYLKACETNNKEDFLQAAQYLEKALGIAPDAEKYYLLAGLSYRACGMQENARAWYRRALLSGNFSRAGFYNLIGHTFREEERYKEAASYYKRAAEADYSFVAAYCNIGDMFVKMNDTDAALQYYAKAIEINSDFITSYIKTGDIYYEQKNYDKAMEWYLKALRVNPDSDKANYLVGMSYKAMGKQDDAVGYLKKAAYCGSDDAVYELRNIGIDLR
ncbi:MAG: tetratricopeptide repeat protein [Endomicrobium sp.]|jgi:tetratricopeptide (TPR) repeat protein|nr:tetratricopeptide repeat protein [Endomicrobium sp.]